MGRMTEIHERELAWAAGFFDGEGNIGRYKNRKGTTIKIQVGQCDREVLDRFQRAVRAGKVFGPYERRSILSDRPQWVLAISSHAEVMSTIRYLWPYLSGIKREQIKQTGVDCAGL